MALYGLWETRSSLLNDPQVSLTNAEAWNETFGWLNRSAAGIHVTEESALAVSAIWQAVNMITSTFASLPCHLYKSTDDGAIKDTKNPLYYIVHDRWNNVHSSAQGWKLFVFRLVLRGRGLAYIDTNKSGRVKQIIPLDPDKCDIVQSVDKENQLTRTYKFNANTAKEKVYTADQIIDVVSMPKPDGVSHYDPIMMNANAIGLMIAAEQYAAKFFANGGVPALSLNTTTVQGMSADAADRAEKGLLDRLRKASRQSSNVLIPPAGHKLEPIGIDPDKGQLLPLRLFSLNEACRIFNIAPALLHDLSKGTYSNVEQQMLSYVRQTIHPLAELIEQEFNAKLFGQRNSSNYIEFNLDGLQRGDLVSRMNGLARAVYSGLLTPNEGRAMDNRPPLEGGDKLFIQGATVPIDQAGVKAAPNPTASDPFNNLDEPTSDTQNKDDNTDE